MSLRKVNNRISTQRKKELLKNIDFIAFVMRSCKTCISANKICRVDEKSEKCLKCIKSDKKCDLAYFLVVLRKTHKERLRVKKEVRETRLKLQHLKRQLKLLKNEKEKMMITK